jgi:Reverse transcriptase (RNA-dependent DNA polymerase)
MCCRCKSTTSTTHRLHNDSDCELIGFCLQLLITSLLRTFLPPNSVENQLQDHLNEISVNCKDWKIKINASKTQAIHFSRCTKSVPQTEITLNGDGILWSDEVKYLGVLLDKRINFFKKICSLKTL